MREPRERTQCILTLQPNLRNGFAVSGGPSRWSTKRHKASTGDQSTADQTECGWARRTKNGGHPLDRRRSENATKTIACVNQCANRTLPDHRNTSPFAAGAQRMSPAREVRPTATHARNSAYILAIGRERSSPFSITYKCKATRRSLGNEVLHRRGEGSINEWVRDLRG